LGRAADLCVPTDAVTNWDQISAPVEPLNDPIVAQTRSAFAAVCSVSVNIRAPAQAVWSLLTDASGFPKWNSTVTAIDGEIREGQRLRIHAPGTDRTFTPLVSGVVANQAMTWTGGVALLFKGVRTFRLTAREDGTTDFAMRERFAGLMMPFVGRSLPDFRPIFTRYANDLRIAAERRDGRAV
jgi:hypothetical protein